MTAISHPIAGEAPLMPRSAELTANAIADPAWVKRVPYVNLIAQYEEEREQLVACLDDVFSSGYFVGGEFVPRFERAVADYVGVKHAVAVNSGTDALYLAMTALGIGPGDEVITPPNSYIASTATIIKCGATPVFADVGADQNIDAAAVEAAITSRTKAIMPVHLTGRVADMDAIMALAERHGLLIVEDAAQAIGSAYGGRRAGAFGDVGCFSTHPVKNLNAAGDGGFVTTNDGALAERIAYLRRHGLVDRSSCVEWGCVSRLDNLQAAFLLMRLAKLDRLIGRRRDNADVYARALDSSHIYYPADGDERFTSFHTFVIQVEGRDRLQQHLAEHGIGSAVHYPVPIHLQPAARDLGYRRGDFPVAERQADRILSLPIHQYLKAADIRFVYETINEFVAQDA